MRQSLWVSAVLTVAAIGAQAQTLTSAQVGGMPYLLLPASGGCSAAAPCSIVTYLSYMDETQAATAADVRTYFGGAFAAANPHTIVVAPMISAPQSTDVSWGGYTSGTTSPEQQAVAVVRAVERQYGAAINAQDAVVTGGSLGGDGTQSMLLQYGPNGQTEPGVFRAGLSFDAALYADADTAATRTALCGVPLMAVHGTADTNQSVTYDKALAATLSGCANFRLDLIEGAGHGTWSGASGYGAGAAPDTPLGWLTVQLRSGTTAPASTTAPPQSPHDATNASRSTPLMSGNSAAAAPAQTGSGALPLPPVPTGTGRPDAAQSADRSVAPTAASVCNSIPSVQTLLPCGPLSSAASQIVDQSGRAVRLNCIAWWPGYANPDQLMLTIVAAGFNCVRISYFNASLSADLTAIDQAVRQAAAVSVRVIINNHANEGGGDCVAQQANGLPFDSGPGTDGTDGCGAAGTVTAGKWVSDWVTVARRYKGNDTVIGYDLWNEPLEIPGGSTWGDGGATDLRVLYQWAGNAIQAIDSDKLIICEGPILWAPLYQADLSHVASAPVMLNRANKVVYSVHEYPSDIGGEPNDSGDVYVQQMNQAFGYLITQNIAPVWVGELGASMDGNAGSNLADEQGWAATIIPYLNGTYPGGLKLPPGGQGLGTDWWALTACDANCGGPDGALEADMATLKHQQAAVYSKFVQAPLAGVAGSGGTSAGFAAQAAAVSATAFPAAMIAATGTEVTAALQAALPAAPAFPSPAAAVQAAAAQMQTNGQTQGSDSLAAALARASPSTTTPPAASALPDVVSGEALARQAEAAVQAQAPAAADALIQQAQATVQAALAAPGGR